MSVFAENLVDFLKRAIEQKSEKFPFDFDALDLWTLNKIIANKMEDFWDNVVLNNLEMSNRVESLSGKITTMQIELENKFRLVDEITKRNSENLTRVHDKIRNIPARIFMAEKFCVNAVTVLKSQLDELTNRLSGFKSSGSHNTFERAGYTIQTDTNPDSMDERDPSSL